MTISPGDRGNGQAGAGSVTLLLKAWESGDSAALAELVARIYDDLRRIASARLRGERRGDLSAGALVGELYLRLAQGSDIDWANRGHFYAVASTVMRRVLVDRARARRREKRQGIHVPLQEASATVPALSIDILDLDAALRKLSHQGYERECRVVELRYFGGLSLEETARQMDLSKATVKRAFTLAKSWLCRELHGANRPGTPEEPT